MEELDNHKVLNDSSGIITMDPTVKEIIAEIATVAASPVLDLLIARKGLIEEHIIVPNRCAFVKSQNARY